MSTTKEFETMLKKEGIKIKRTKLATVIDLFGDYDKIKITKHSVTITNFCIENLTPFSVSFSYQTFMEQIFGVELSGNEDYIEIYLEEDEDSRFDFEMKRKKKKQYLDQLDQLNQVELFSDLIDLAREEIERLRTPDDSGFKIDLT